MIGPPEKPSAVTTYTKLFSVTPPPPRLLKADVRLTGLVRSFRSMNTEACKCLTCFLFISELPAHRGHTANILSYEGNPSDIGNQVSNFLKDIVRTVKTSAVHWKVSGSFLVLQFPDLLPLFKLYLTDNINFLSSGIDWDYCHTHTAFHQQTHTHVMCYSACTLV